MTDTGFFKYVWRLNSVLIFAVGALVLVMAVKAMLDEYRGNRYVRRRAAPRDSTLQLSRPILVDNKEFYLMALSPGGEEEGKGQWQDVPIRNFLVVDAETNAHHWLLPDTTNTILKWNEITRDMDCGMESVGLELVTAPLDTNGDGVRDWRDRLVHLVSSSPAFEPRDLVGEPVDFFQCEENGGRLFCEFQTDQGLETAIFALDQTMTQLSRSVLPQLPDTAGGEGGRSGSE